MKMAGAALVAMLAAEAGAAQGPSIDHQQARCFVAGRSTTLRACFEPRGSVATARIRYRLAPEGAWTDVSMRAVDSCHEGVIPPLMAATAGHTVPYYLEVFDRAAGSSRTAEFRTPVVARSADCAEAGAGAHGGRGTSRVLVIGGIAAAGAAVALTAAGSDAEDSPTTTQPAGPPVRQSPTPPSTVAPVPPGSDLAATCQANPRTGVAPLRVEFATFPTGGTGTYEFEWSFGDGNGSRNPNPAHTYVSPGRFEAVVHVTSGAERVTCGRAIEVTAVPTPDPGGPVPTPSPTAVPTPSPTPTPTPPPLCCTLTVTMFGNHGFTVTSNPAGMTCTTPNNFPLPSQAMCTAPFTQGTILVLSASSPFAIFGGCDSSNPCRITMLTNRTVSVIAQSGGRPGSEEPMLRGISSHLEMDGGAGRVSVNGTAATTTANVQTLHAGTRRGVNVVEGVLAGARQAGSWRFEIHTGLRPGSLRVTSGTVAVITPDVVVFRLEGKPGERVAFTFEVD